MRRDEVQVQLIKEDRTSGSLGSFDSATKTKQVHAKNE